MKTNEGYPIKKKLISLLISFVFMLSFCGCWDYMEIERRGYILGVAIDIPSDPKIPSKSLEYMQLESTGPLYAYTIQIPIISRSQSKPTGQSGGNADKERDWNLTVMSNTFFEANRQFSTRLDYVPYYSHLQAIVLSEDTAREDISKVIDLFIRDPEMRRRTKVYITPGSARSVLKVIPKIDDYSSQYLRNLPNNSKRTSRILHKMDLGKISESIHQHRDFVIPKVAATQYEIKDAGCVVFKDNKMVGELDEVKTSYLKLIENLVQGGFITINYPKLNNSTISLEFSKAKTKQKPMVQDGSAKMQLDVNAVMNIAEISSNETYNATTPESISEIENLAEIKIKKQIQDTIKYVQQEYGTDIFFFDVSFKRFAPREWSKLKDNWREVFKTLDVDVNVKVKINETGITR